jgi:hypothetical protein
MRFDIGGPPNKKGRPRAAVQPAFLSDVGPERPRHAKSRRGGRRAQFQLWIFSYTVLARSSKKRLSRILIGTGDEFGP